MNTTGEILSTISSGICASSVICFPFNFAIAKYREQGVTYHQKKMNLWVTTTKVTQDMQLALTALQRMIKVNNLIQHSDVPTNRNIFSHVRKHLDIDMIQYFATSTTVFSHTVDSNSRLTFSQGTVLLLETFFNESSLLVSTGNRACSSHFDLH